MVWLKEDDACTRFFHLKAKGHRRNIFIRKNFIACLKDGAGEYKWSHEDKERLPHSHFQRILGTKEPRGCGLNWSELNLTQLPEYHGIDEVFTEYEIKRDIDLLPLP
jgi:hypothetical protein